MEMEKKDAMSNDVTQGNISGKKIRKKQTLKTWMEMNGHPCDGGPMDGLLIKGQRVFKTMWKKPLEVTGVKSYYKFTDFFQKIT